MKRFALTLAFVVSAALPAFSGEQYVDDSGFAVSGYNVVVSVLIKPCFSPIPDPLGSAC
ncbi:MAG: hypothetical protein ACI92Z_003730 [Paracoccaceae bacterium]|jgi:hypothetical protein